MLPPPSFPTPFSPERLNEMKLQTTNENELNETSEKLDAFQDLRLALCSGPPVENTQSGTAVVAASQSVGLSAHEQEVTMVGPQRDGSGDEDAESEGVMSECLVSDVDEAAGTEQMRMRTMAQSLAPLVGR